MGIPNLTWIQTRDGSPTLWSNDLSESYRSVKGAFTESWAAFVGPALDYHQAQIDQNQPVSWVGEFGLGAGTNWALWTVGLRARGLPAPVYFAIERDPAAFALGLAKFAEMAATLSDFLAKHGLALSPAEVRATLAAAPLPRLYASLPEACTRREAGDHGLAEIWFHDPFGFGINPDGYSAETIGGISRLLAPRFWGASYACNKYFRAALGSIPNAQLRKVGNDGLGLKRERLEFFRT